MFNHRERVPTAGDENML